MTGRKEGTGVLLTLPCRGLAQGWKGPFPPPLRPNPKGRDSDEKIREREREVKRKLREGGKGMCSQR
jgi:hypothetical protein